MKSVILAIVGAAGSGKTFAAELMGKIGDIPVVCSYTTRQMRDGEVDGVDHYYVTAGEMPVEEEILAYTLYGGHHYWTEKRQVPDGGKCIYVIDEKGLVELNRRHKGLYEVVSILIKRDQEILQQTISKERTKRDEGRVVLEDHYYTYIIENNETIKELREELQLILNQI